MNRIEKWLLKTPQYTRHARHFRSVVQHGTPRKLMNLARVEIERKRKKIRLKSRPYILFLDPTNFCNLRCPLCPTGVNDLGRKQSMLALDKFKKYIDPHLPYLLEVNLHNWGESLLNKEVFDMIRYARDNNVGTNMSSNFSMATEHHIDQLLDAGLEYLIISLDGTSQESYEQYRVRGDYEKVVANARMLIEKRNARGLKYPFVEWQFIVMKQNEDEVEQAEKISQDIGIDLLRFIHVGIPYDFADKDELKDKWYPEQFGKSSEKEKKRPEFKPSPCFYLYRSMIVNSNGGVSPCCEVYQENRDFDSLEDHDVIDIGKIWNGEKYLTARAQFSPENVSPVCETVCDDCTIFRKYGE
jgi:MoaA/NifB/PqqE/SkfB family radical SAM enzyme